MNHSLCLAQAIVTMLQRKDTVQLLDDFKLASMIPAAGGAGLLESIGEDEDGGDDSKQPGWLKFIYKSLDFGSGRERGARS